MKMAPLLQEFVLHFGEMGSRWGINRTVGQIYAVLFLSKTPLNAEEITTALGISRSNTSMGLKELQAWNLVRLRHLPDDRRDYFTTPDDLWEIVRTLVAERKKREIDPTLTKLRELIEMMSTFYEDMNRLETERLVQLMTLGAKLGGLVEKTSRLNPFTRTKG